MYQIKKIQNFRSVFSERSFWFFLNWERYVENHRYS